MAIDTSTRISKDEIVRLGEEILHLQIEPKHGATETGKFVAIDVESGAYEIDEDDYTAVMRLRALRPSAEMFLARVDRKAAYELRASRSSKESLTI